MPPREPQPDDDVDDPRIAVAEDARRERNGDYQPTDKRDGFGDYGYSPNDCYERPV